jgi:hypothetical protein
LIVCACVCACVRVCVCACVRVCMCGVRQSVPTPPSSTVCCSFLRANLNAAGDVPVRAGDVVAQQRPEVPAAGRGCVPQLHVPRRGPGLLHPVLLHRGEHQVRGGDRSHPGQGRGVPPDRWVPAVGRCARVCRGHAPPTTHPPERSRLPRQPPSKLACRGMLEAHAPVSRPPPVTV